MLLITAGITDYYLQNHLGNTLATVKDVKQGIDDDGDGWIDRYEPIVTSATDYSPFGVNLMDRSYNSSLITLGFNSKWNDVASGYQDYGMRDYSERGRIFIKVDPITSKYSHLTPYQFVSNRPIDGIDLDGLEFFKKDNTNYNVEYKPVLNAPNVATGVCNAAHNTLALVWNGTLGAIGNLGKSVNNYFAGGYKELDNSPDPVNAFMETTNEMYRYVTRTPAKQQLKDLGNAATDLRNYEIIPSLLIAHKLSAPSAGATFSGDIINARRQLASNWGIHVENVNFSKQVFTQAAEVNDVYYQYRIPGTDAGSYFVKSLDITPEQVGLLSSEYTDVYKVTVNRRTQSLVSTHIEDARYWRNNQTPVQGGGQQIFSPELKNNATFEKINNDGN